jgi:predicted ATPase
MTPRPPELMVLNEPEGSLHADLLPALARLIANASERSQVIVVTHATRLVASLESREGCHSILLDKELGQTVARGAPAASENARWEWPPRQ